jgi:hypothetical protein
MQFEKFEEFLFKLFGNGKSFGPIQVLVQDTEASEKSRDFDLISDFLTLQAGNSTVLFNTVTENGEIVAATSAPSGLEPTGYLKKGDTSVPFWATSEAVKLPSHVSREDCWLPAPGLNGWDLEVNGEVFEPSEVFPKQRQLDLSRYITLACGKNFNATEWKNVELSIEEFIGTLSDHVEGEKEGPCLLQGEIFEEKGTTRKAKGMIKNHVICLDLDNGLTHQEIDTALAKKGFAYIRYTTHSHNLTSTNVSKTQYEKHFKDTPVNITNLREFLRTKKGYTNAVAATADKYEYVQKADGDYYKVSHAPVSKNRIVFFLREPFVFRDENAPASMIEKWKKKYLGFAETLGIPYDTACTDAARIFYFPRHPKGREDFETKFFDGELVDLFSFPDVSPQAVKQRNREPTVYNKTEYANSPLAAAQAFLGTKKETPVDNRKLHEWSRTHTFEIVNAISDFNPDMIVDMKAKGGKGAHIVCPNEDSHSVAGGSGTYAVNSSESEGDSFEIHCTHAHCQELGKIGLLKLMIESGEYFEEDAMTDEAYSSSLIDENEKEEEKSESPKTKDTQKTQEEVKPTRKEKKKSSFQGIVDVLEQMNEEYASIISNKTLTFLKWVPEAIHEDGYILMNENAFHLDAGAKFKMSKSDLTDKESYVNMWKGWVGHRQYKEVRFDPSNSVDPSVFNTFRGFKAVAPIKGDWSTFKHHLKDVLCSGNEYHYNVFMTWMAHIVQRPWEKPGFAVVITGGKGVGKTMIGEMLRRCVTPYSHSIVQGDQITGKFNAHFDNNLLTIGEEAFFAGDVGADSAMKNLITNIDMMTESKGSDVRTKKNYSRVMLFSNEGWVIRADSTKERRYFCFNIPYTVLMHLPDTYFQDIYTQMLKEKGLEAFMYELMNWIPPFEEGWEVLRVAPVTEELKNQQASSISVAERFFVEFLSDGYCVDVKSSTENQYLNRDKETRLNYNSLYTSFKSYTANTSSRYKTRADFDLLCDRYLCGVKKFDKMNEIVLVVPPLDGLREFYNKNHQTPLIVKDIEVEEIRKPRLVYDKSSENSDSTKQASFDKI